MGSAGRPRLRIYEWVFAHAAIFGWRVFEFDPYVPFKTRTGATSYTSSS